jgi:D-beta-D-heptose 7-phosphate kinase/D-beta-D-heptose 1-phosphate adenosyltransferase
MDGLNRVLNTFDGIKILVIGDLMLDKFVSGDVDRISPESPVPVLTIREENLMLGGAGNVLSNLCALGIKPFIFALVGTDAAADTVRALAKEQGVDTAGLMADDTRPTILKTRYLARHQQLLRSDVEKTHAISNDLESKMLDGIQKAVKDARAIVLSDYGKGTLTPSLIQDIIKLAQSQNVPVLVDPKGKDYSIYHGADVVTPNRKELAEAAGASSLKTDDEITAAAQKIMRECGIKSVVATRSEDGLSVISPLSPPYHIPAQALEVFDVSGAGDTVISVLAASLAAGADIKDAALLANIAGGIAVSKVGTSPVRMDELTRAVGGVPQTPYQSPLLSWAQAAEQVRKWKASGARIGFTNGCFDIVHKGHVGYLAQARAKCDKLIVALNKDISVRLLKGPTRPVNDEEARAAVIGSLGSVDLVVLFGAEKQGEDNTPCVLIGNLKPDVFFKGGDYTVDQLPEAKIVQSYGGEVKIMPMYDGYSTTSIIEKSRKSG